MFGQQANSSGSGSGSVSGSGSSSSRKNKKNTNSDKPKIPQRGLGVAQLERLRHQMAYGYIPTPHPPFPSPLTQEGAYGPLMQSSASLAYSQSQSSSSAYGYHPNTMMGFGDMERANITYGTESQPRWNPSNVVQELHHQQYQQYASSSGMSTRPLLPSTENSMQTNNRRTEFFEALGSSSQNSESSSENQEVDLELRLSI
ncbi:hypothetical protein Ancab_028589 [Ancistrocladus abbreviatus]